MWTDLAQRQHLFKSLICCNDWVHRNYACMLGARCNIKMQGVKCLAEGSKASTSELPKCVYNIISRLTFATSQVQSIPIHCHPSPTVGLNVQQQRGEGWFISLSTSSSSSPRSSSSGSLTATEGTAGSCPLLTLMALGVLEHIYGTGSFITRMTFYGDRHQMTPVELRSGQCSLQLSA